MRVGRLTVILGELAGNGRACDTPAGRPLLRSAWLVMPDWGFDRGWCQLTCMCHVYRIFTFASQLRLSVGGLQWRLHSGLLAVKNHYQMQAATVRLSIPS